MEKIITLRDEINKLDITKDATEIVRKLAEIKELSNDANRIADFISSTYYSIKLELSKKIHEVRNELDGIEVINDRHREVAPGITLPVIAVPTVDNVPDIPLYYSLDTQEFVIKVLGTVISGNVGRLISTKNKSGSIPEFKVQNWIYSPVPYGPKNREMRHVGHRDTLLQDLKFESRRMIKLRNKMLMHDLLITLSASQLNKD